MNPYFTKTLLADFPTLYRQHSLSPAETCMCWLFECGDGWEPIIRGLSGQLEWLNEHSPVWVEAVQVKEKFGTLRFYVTLRAGDGPWADIVWELCDAAETRSTWTCERCGSTSGERRNDGGWLSTLCDECWGKGET